MKYLNKYLIRAVAFICLVASSNLMYAQKISKKDAITDFEFLNEAVVNAHGANYHSNLSVNIDSLLGTVRALKSDSISIPDFRYYLGVALSEIGCLHTSVKEFPLDVELPKERFFPIPVLLVDQSLYIDNHKSKTTQKYVGQKIEKINSHSSVHIVDRLLNYLGGDGRGSQDSYAEEIASLYAPKLISYYLNQPSKFKIKTSLGTFTVSSSNKANYRYRTIVSMQKQERILEAERAFYQKRDNIPVLRIEKFKKKDPKFWDLVFEELFTENPPFFVIDLRGNTGGNREAGAALMQYLTNENFGYAILQPKRKPKPYLNKQGKRYYRFSKLKYNVGEFSHKNNTELGNSFRFNFKPNKSTYKGQLIVLTDGFTASTSTMLTTWLDKHSNAIFIGRTSGGGYNGNNGGVFPKITLPCSKTMLRFPLYRIVLDDDYKKENGLKPDIEVDYSVNDWLEKKDRDWEAVLDFIQAR
ncbi:MAG: hypothetical protein GQ574_19455 [Crocinitomix sp.]|nr:hypothetical protein [Crocinitomix sp.]